MWTRGKEFKLRTAKKCAAENTWTVYQIQEDLRTYDPKETKYKYSNRLGFCRSLESGLTDIFPEQWLVIKPDLAWTANEDADV